MPAAHRAYVAGLAPKRAILLFDSDLGDVQTRPTDSAGSGDDSPTSGHVFLPEGRGQSSPPPGRRTSSARRVRPSRAFLLLGELAVAKKLSYALLARVGPVALSAARCGFRGLTPAGGSPLGALPDALGRHTRVAIARSRINAAARFPRCCRAASRGSTARGSPTIEALVSPRSSGGVNAALLNAVNAGLCTRAAAVMACCDVPLMQRRTRVLDSRDHKVHGYLGRQIR